MSDLDTMSVDELKQALVDTRAQVASLQGPKKPSKLSGVSAGLKKIGASIAAALTTPEAIKAEKSLAVIALTRLAILLPGAALLIDLLVQALGGPSVKP